MSFNYTTNADIEQELQSANVVPAWFTTMNIFKALGGFTPNSANGQANIAGGSNYFRVSPFAVESRFNYIKQDWMDEEKCELPKKDTYVGYMGLTERAGNPEGDAVEWALGFQTFDGHPLIMHSTSETCMRSYGWIQFCSNYSNPGGAPKGGVGIGEKEELYHSTSSAGVPMSYLQLGFFINKDTEKVIDKGQIRGHVHNKGGIYFIATNEKPTGDDQANISGKDFKKNVAGLVLNGGNADDMPTGSWLWNQKDEVHIISGDMTKHPEGTDTTADTTLGYSELWLNKAEARITADGAWSLCLGNNAHASYYGSYRIGMDKSSSMWCHPDQIAIWTKSQPG